MSFDTQELLAPEARQIAQYVDLTLECSQVTWLSLIARFATTDKAMRALAFANGDAAVATVDALSTQVRR
ncbi:hypothetical protein JWH11_19085 [Xanthomonas melonis]|uniref:Uncharacterized protein n=1 Tax=Xanthomonas melonis TaxID=56456 RepID=A0ABS8NZG8_9XANT|nr:MULTISPECIES: hypothetical protein [Xanthomonas]MCC4585944.1 hypothetical protein [Xanthomonas sp. NCPPB 1067]MCD0246542.1 hypothetical protein [Xanthomonas melonis]MCD0260590.1 hypothetical protein [Xanthomonas melonis]MCD0268500.1 hypothetical protein [Xanthomonas melonis]MCD0279372.1 hypothetical protein [Xanthomonas melonis]